MNTTQACQEAQIWQEQAQSKQEETQERASKPINKASRRTSIISTTGHMKENEMTTSQAQMKINAKVKAQHFY